MPQNPLRSPVPLHVEQHVVNVTTTNNVPADVIDYLRYHGALRGGNIKAERHADDERNVTIAVQFDTTRLQDARWVKIWNIEYDPQGIQRGFNPHSRIKTFYRYDAQTGERYQVIVNLLTSVYTRWAKEWWRVLRAEEHATHPGPFMDAKTWVDLISSYYQEALREPFETCFSLRVPSPQ